ncbi:arginine--tRNA ligase domain-containing protein [Sphingomonas sp. RS6]
MSQLERAVRLRQEAVEAKRDALVAAHDAAAFPAMRDYALPALEALLTETVREATGVADAQIQLDLIARDKFGGDIALKVPSLLKQGGPKRFVAEFQPAIAAALQSEALSGVIRSIELKGMYINLVLTDDWLLRTAESVVRLDTGFCLNDTMASQRVVVDYSSPNVAKVLHAGHIRSTITGHVLANLYDACAATVFRLNHINDFGGFGFTLEGYRRFADRMPAEFSPNDRLLALYGIRRTLERIVQGNIEAADWTDEDRAVLDRYFPEVSDLASARAAFADFTAASDARFAALEAGDADEVALWEQMVDWSMAAFDEFYRLLNIDIDFVIGESFYYQDGLDVIARALADGTAEVFSEAQAEAEIAAVGALRDAGEISDAEAQVRIQAVRKDIGATIVRLPSGERLVLLRTDGRSIYATRDIGAIARRNALFAPTLVQYVVGQEQRSHFERLFAAAEVIGLVKDGIPQLEHLYFGFYVDEKTGKKLSSRQSVSNVMTLLEMSEQYFRARLSERDGVTEADRDLAARQLTVGSLVFNDLKQDIKGSVDIDVSSLENTIQGFEKAGGAYAVYTACRARSILRRHGQPSKPVDAIGAFELTDQEVELLLKLQQTPVKVAEAAARANPTHLIRHLLDIAMAYNSYYTAAPVLSDGGVNEARLLITNAVQIALVNALRICHITTPTSI